MESSTAKGRTRTFLADTSKADQHQKAKLVLEAVSVEWQRRAGVTGDRGFKRPSTEARGGDGSLRFDKAQSEGMLAYLEYRVGRTNGFHSPVRQSILSRVFEGSLPPVFEQAYMDEWGGNRSETRLRKMAESIAAFARNAKRKNDDALDEAIRQWEQDLKFLYDRYYIGHFRFGWPVTNVN